MIKRKGGQQTNWDKAYEYPKVKQMYTVQVLYSEFLGFWIISLVIRTYGAIVKLIFCATIFKIRVY